MSIPTIYFGRHGTTDANVESLYRPEDVHLDAHGERDALHMAKNLMDCGIRRIISSPVPRAAQTARIVAQKLGIKECSIIFNARLKPIGVGAYAGLDRTKNPLTRYTAATHWEIPGGDSIDGFCERIQEVVPEVISFAKNWGPLLVLTHSSTLAAMYAEINKCPVDIQTFEFIKPGGIGTIDARGRLVPYKN